MSDVTRSARLVVDDVAHTTQRGAARQSVPASTAEQTGQSALRKRAATFRLTGRLLTRELNSVPLETVWGERTRTSANPGPGALPG